MQNLLDKNSAKLLSLQLGRTAQSAKKLASKHTKVTQKRTRANLTRLKTVLSSHSVTNSFEYKKILVSSGRFLSSIPFGTKEIFFKPTSGPYCKAKQLE